MSGDALLKVKNTSSVGEPGVDIYRDTWIRYLGYANEVGEAFGPRFPQFVRPSYGVAFAYCGADAVDKAVKAARRGERTSEVVRIGTDAILWQTLASVLIPGKVINLVTATAVKLMQSDAKAVKLLPLKIRTWSPTVIGLATIPFIISPIDHAVDALFDNTLRKWWPSSDLAEYDGGTSFQG
jgi:fission process protein 1